jgi:hypothetical protein
MLRLLHKPVSYRKGRKDIPQRTQDNAQRTQRQMLRFLQKPLSYRKGRKDIPQRVQGFHASSCFTARAAKDYANSKKGYAKSAKIFRKGRKG